MKYVKLRKRSQHLLLAVQHTEMDVLCYVLKQIVEEIILCSLALIIYNLIQFES